MNKRIISVTVWVFAQTPQSYQKCRDCRDPLVGLT
jgi:hypothetical protein